MNLALSTVSNSSLYFLSSISFFMSSFASLFKELSDLLSKKIIAAAAPPRMRLIVNAFKRKELAAENT
jgi:hypothetical protein